MKGGGTHILPGVSKMTSLQDYENIYNTFIVTGHGSTSPGTFKVPDNTYILHLTNVGDSCPGNKHADLLFKTDYNNNFFKFIQDPSKKMKIYNPFNTKPVKKYNDKTSIYEPGDLIPDSIIKFENENFFGAIAIDKLPMDDQIQTIETNNQAQIMSIVQSQLLTPFEKDEQIKKKLAQMDQTFLQTTIHGTILADMIRTKNKKEFTLQEIVNEINTRNPGKKNFIIVEICRDVAPSLFERNFFGQFTPQYHERVKQIRRGSFSVRKFFEKGTFVQFEDGTVGNVINPSKDADGKIKVRKGYTSPTVDLVDPNDLQIIGEPKPVHPIQFKKGDSVILHGLTSELYNETLATIIKKHENDENRYDVTFFNGNIAHVKKENILYNWKVNDKVNIGSIILPKNAIITKVNSNGTFVVSETGEEETHTVTFTDLNRRTKNPIMNLSKLSNIGGTRHKKLKYKATRKQSKSRK